MGHLVAGRSIPRTLDVPVNGSFAGSVGTFIANDALNDKPITVRFTWHPSAGANPVWKQAFSADDGTTWEANWVMEFVRQ